MNDTSSDQNLPPKPAGDTAAPPQALETDSTTVPTELSPEEEERLLLTLLRRAP